ncbi:hypothetical protein HN451_07960 [archaeon]|nr:hypothetical protein [archaeon]
MIRSFSMGSNLPPEYPFFAGEKMTYHFLFYLIVAGLENLGMQIDFAFNFLSAFGSALLLTTIVYLGELFFSFFAGLLAVFLFLFNGSFSFIKFFEKNIYTGFGSVIQKIISQREFVSFGPWDGGIVSAFWNLNIFTNQRHLGLGIAVFLFLAGFFEKKFLTKENKKLFFSKKEMFFIGFLIIILPILHQASFAALGVYFLVSLFSNRKKLSFRSITFIGLAGLLSLYIYYFFGSSFTPILELGFLAKEKTIFGILNYWFYNFGLYIFFIPVLSYLILFNKNFSKHKKNTGYKNIFFTGLIIFIIANIFRFSMDMINNHKFITIFLIIMNIGVAGLLAQVFLGSTLWKKILGLFILFTLTFSGFIDLFPILNDSIVGKKDYNQTELGRWAVTTELKSSFLVNEYLYNPISLAGRKLYLDYGYFSWSMGYPDKERRRKQFFIFNKDISQIKWCEVVKHEGIDYLALSMRHHEVLDEYNSQEAAFLNFITPQIFDKSLNGLGTHVYSVKEICQ